MQGLETSGTAGRAGAGIRRPGPAPPRPAARPPARPARAAYHLERDAELSFARRLRACCPARPDGRPPARPPAPPAAGSTGGQHPPCSRAGSRAPAAPPDRMLTRSPIHSPIHRSAALGGEAQEPGSPPTPQQPTPQKGRGCFKKKKKAGLSYSFFFFSFHPPTQHSIKRTKTDILFADLANIKAISMVHRSSPKLVQVVACGSPAKLSFNSYRMPFGDRRGETGGI